MKRDFAALANQAFDLLVIGGGIYGAWTAYDAALRGLRVAIVEQNDWASGTSSASSKLIHGGLRYLETGDVNLVKKALAERERLLRLAPHRVWPLDFGVPVYAGSRLKSWKLRIGLTVYDFFAGKLFAPERHRRLSQQAFAARFPMLGKAALQSGFIYGDAQTDDARLVLELVAGAMQHGAIAVNYCRVTQLQEQEGKACGAIVAGQLDGNTVNIAAKQIVDATGRWAATHAPCRLTKGVHLVLPSTGVGDALLLTAPSDGRVFFILPWYGVTVLGTTDTDYRGNVDQVTVESQDMRYLLDAANAYLKTAWTEADVAGSFAGVRVMRGNEQSSPSSVSRDWELVTTNNGVHYSLGGKITSAREDAANIVDAVCAQLGVQTSCATQDAPLPWTPDTDFRVWSENLRNQAKTLGVDDESCLWLMRRHGRHAEHILRSIASDTTLAHRIVPTLPLIYADLRYCAQHEMVMRQDDLLRRRIPLQILAKLDKATLQRVAEIISV
jgi:glycerol-3-phosphate dehydrogenase